MKATDNEPSDGVIAVIVGAEGTANVVIEFEAADATDVPALFVAVTVNVYAVPVVNPFTVIVPEPAWIIVPVTPPGEDVAVYDKIVAPPSEPGAVKPTVAVVDPVAVATPIVGAPGTVRGVTAAETVEDGPVPAALVALTRNVYDVPFVKPVTVADADVQTPSLNVDQIAPELLENSTL